METVVGRKALHAAIWTSGASLSGLTAVYAYAVGLEWWRRYSSLPCAWRGHENAGVVAEALKWAPWASAVWLLVSAVVLGLGWRRRVGTVRSTWLLWAACGVVVLASLAAWRAMNGVGPVICDPF